MTKVIPGIKILTSITVVFFLLLSAIRVLISPVFLEIEYRMPGFPEDPYGFRFEERLDWAKVSLLYLLNDVEPEFLENQELDNGQPLYNKRELSHMVDVKILVRQMIISWYISIALLILFGLFAREAKFIVEFWSAFSKGGLITISLIVMVLIVVLLSFDMLFTGFHKIFFEGDTWLFSYSDTLIRLFPIRFWQDAFILVGVLSVLGGGIVFYLGRKLMIKHSKEQEK